MGKTSAIELFGKEYDLFISLNLELSAEKELFERDLSIEDLYQAILLHKNLTRSAGKTLLFIDEIQNSPKAVALLRYFFEKMPRLHVIAAGSLLDVSLKKSQISFPVGRVEFLYLYPFDFREFLTAAGESELVSLLDQVPFPDYACQKLFEHFHRYALIGGMPEVVAKYLKTKDVTALSRIYHSQITTFQEDVEKYAPHSARTIRHCIETAPLEAGKRIKFAGFGNSNYKSREMGEALRTLEQTMLLYLLYPSTDCEIPVRVDLKKSPRLQFIDTGLLNYTAKLQQHYFSQETLHDFYRGLIAEHIVGQELLAQSSDHTKPIFWVREKKQSTAEVDYLFFHKGQIFPVEVKGGKSGTLKSIHQFIDRSEQTLALRMYAGPVWLSSEKTGSGRDYQLLSIPYFLASKIGDSIDWALNQS